MVASEPQAYGWRRPGRNRAFDAIDRGVDNVAGRAGGIGVGGILVIVGIVVALVWSFWLGLIIALIGLIAFGGFVRGKWY